ncbi:MAG TPA: N-acetylmuramoyl-L-alanine amidase, partial [Terriglobales bacterium]|nr:N-acetylmuramoyl-L-alanine amidase [Terriglobales bacterium]
MIKAAASCHTPSRLWCIARNAAIRAAIQVTLLLAVLVMLAWQPSAAHATSKRERAAQAYESAVQMQAAFNARSKQSHSAKDYLKLVRAFDLVYRTDPAYSNTPAAIAAEATLYREMGGVFFSRSYYESAAASYQFLADQYPGATVARNALFTAGDIYRVDLQDPDQATKAYTRYITTYPYAPKVQEAKLRLKELNAHLAAQASRRAKAAEAADSEPTDSEPANSEPAGRPKALGDLVAVNDVHYWEGSDYTRIVVTLADEAKVESQRLSHPDRLVFDLPGARVGRPLAGKDFSVGTGFVQHIRVAQFKPDTARLVLDVSGVKDYSTFTLPNPYRLIIDVHGPAQAPVAGAPSRSVSAADAGTSRPPAKASQSASGLVAKATPPASVSDPTWQPFGAPGSSRPKPIADPDNTVKEYDITDAEKTGRPTSKPTPAVDTGSRSAESATEVPAGTVTSPALPRTQTSVTASSGSPTLTRALGLKIARIVIDPGHGGHDTGTIGPEGLEEKNVVLDVGLRLRKLIQQRMGSEVVMTRSDDTFIPLEERTAIANERNADLFISIHANASRDESARGIEVYYLNLTSDPGSMEVAARENATSQESVNQLQSLVKKIALSEKVE